MDRDSLRPEQNVAVGQREPETVLRQTQQDRIVQDAALGVGDEHVLALSDRHGGEIARGQHLYEPRRIGTGDLDLTLDRDIAEDRLVDQV